MLDQDWMDGISGVSTLHARWQNLDGPFPMQRTRLSRNDSKPGVSSQPLIKEEMSNPMVMLKFPIN